MAIKKMLDAHHSQEDISFSGIGLRDLWAMDRLVEEAWAKNFAYLAGSRIRVTMEIHEIAVNELLTGKTLPFAVSDIINNVDADEMDKTWSWKLVKRSFEKMEAKGHIRLFEGNDPAKIKVKYRITTEFREIVRDYYRQYAKSVRVMMTRMQINDATASFEELVADNPDLISELGLEGEEGE